MTKVRFHGPVAGFSGAMGEMVFADNEKRGRTVAYMKKHYELSEAQVNQQARFTEASRHAQAILSDPALRAFYQPIADERGINAHALAMADYLNLPTIQPLDLSNYKGRIGDTILIRAEDDLGLAGLDVSIVAQDGTPIESGKAVELGARSGHWVYTATAPVALGADVFIEVTGVDHANNEVKITENPTVGTED